MKNNPFYGEIYRQFLMMQIFNDENQKSDRDKIFVFASTTLYLNIGQIRLKMTQNFLNSQNMKNGANICRF